jgi:hypothetical protein
MLSEEAIRQRSYQIWQREGCPAGKADEHWFRARAELEAEQPKREYRTAAYHMILYRFDEKLRSVLPRPRISAPPQKFVASRISREQRPAA